MSRIWPLALLPALLFAKADIPGNLPPSTNVNSRYTVESVEIAPVGVSGLSSPLRTRVQALTGARFDQELLDEIAQKIRREMRNWTVSLKVSRGTLPEHVKVVFQVEEKRDNQIVSEVPRLLYHSKENFTFGMDATVKRKGHAFTIGALTDNDEMLERFSGVRGSYQREGLANHRIKVKFEVESWRSQWAGDVPGRYRSRFEFRPTTTVVLLRPLTLQLGVSVDRMELETPSARRELSGAAVATLRFQRRWEFTPTQKHDLEASYGIRSASKAVSGDFGYTRHHVEARYALQGTNEELIASFQAGMIEGRAPIYERFILGNSRTLRGWSKYDIAPLGTDRMAHASLEYRYRMLRVIYDTGAAWQHNGPATLRHSAAIGIASNHFLGLTALIAFPLREGRIEPIFMTGINF